MVNSDELDNYQWLLCDYYLILRIAKLDIGKNEGTKLIQV